MDTTVFYSWQSDNHATRHYVEKTLKRAVTHIVENPDVDIAPRIDKDTQGASGAVHIVDTIKKKINDCGIFLADVSLVDTASSGRHIVNQNVMFELGYAMGVHSEARVILVANSDLGDLKNLPFDISHHRVISFSPIKDPKGERLEASLESAISVHLDTLEKEKRANDSLGSKEKLVEAIENSKPTRTLSRNYFKEIYLKYLELSPGRYDGSEETELYARRTYEAYISTRSLSLELFSLLNLAAEYKNGEVLAAAYKALENVSQYYDAMPEDVGTMYEISEEYYGLIVYEVIALILGLIAREKMWSTMTQIARTKLSKSERYGGAGRTLDELYRWPQYTLEYYKKLKNAQYYIPTTPLIQERFKGEEDALQAYIDGSLLRLFITNDYSWIIGVVMSSSWERYTPQFIEEFKSRDFAAVVKDITGEKTFDEFATNIWNQATHSIGYMVYYHNLAHLFQHFGIASSKDIYGGTSQVIEAV